MDSIDNHTGISNNPDSFMNTSVSNVRNHLKTRQLLLIAALAEEGNVHRAAAALNMTQPAASKTLRELEEALGVTLFDREPRGVRPTLYGAAVIRHARAVLGSLDQAQEELLALKSGRLGHVSIGAITSPGVRLLPAAVAAVKRLHADIRVSVEIDGSNALLERLAQDKLDIVIGRLSAEQDNVQLRYAPLAGEPARAVVRAEHPLLKRKALALADVQQAAWLVPPAGSVLRHRFDLMFQRASLAPPSNVVETAAILFVTQLLEQSDMIAVLAEDVARYYARHRIVEVLPLQMDCRMDDYGIVTRADRLLTPATETMVRALKAAALDVYGPQAVALDSAGAR